jgi:hypothetical protein
MCTLLGLLVEEFSGLWAREVRHKFACFDRYALESSPVNLEKKVLKRQRSATNMPQEQFARDSRR